MNFDPSGLFFLVFDLPAFVAALTVHEFAHAWMADRLGDDTPRRMGRLTLDPLAHLDPLGSLFWVIMALTGAPLIAWARPVPFNPRNLSQPRRDAVLIALAGPISNLLQVPIWLLALYLWRLIVEHTGGQIDFESLYNFLVQDFHVRQMPNSATLVTMVIADGVMLNVLLAAFNMIPIPPLDGHYVLEALGPPYVTQLYNTLRPYSFLVLLMLLQTPLLSKAIGPFEGFALDTVLRVVGGI